MSRAAGRPARVPSLNALARASLFLAALGASACLDTTPTYIVPAQSPPIILGNQVVPSTVTVNVVSLNEPQQLDVPFKSIDSGEALVAIFFLDLQEKTSLLLKSQSVKEDSRPLDEQDHRDLAYPWTATPAGCRTVTMELSHASNFPTDPEKGIFQPGVLPPLDQSDIAQVTWFFDVRDPSAPTTTPCWSTQ